MAKMFKGRRIIFGLMIFALTTSFSAGFLVSREALLADLISCEFRFGARVQEPSKPYSYGEQEVSYLNQIDNVTISGTLTFPYEKEKFPVVILVGGYGKIDRDATTLGHRYFLVLADYLTRQGIGVLRFDKRGVGKSTGNFKTATSIDLARDVSAGIDFLKTQKNIDVQNIGLIGHSEGGLVSAIVCSERKDIAFAVLLAPALAITLEDIVYHAGRQLRFEGASEHFIERDASIRKMLHLVAKQEYNPEKTIEKMRLLLECYFKNLSAADKEEMEHLSLAFTPLASEFWMRLIASRAIYFFMHYDVSKMLRKIKNPLLLLYGSKDGIASVDRAQSVIECGLKEGGNTDYTVVELAGHNHYFQRAQTGALKEYGDIEETISFKALETIFSWIKVHVK